MPIRVTLTGILDEFWGADDAFADGGQARIRELIEDDLSALMENLSLKVEKIDGPKGRAVGGHARAAALSPKRRKEIASHAAKSRWGTK